MRSTQATTTLPVTNPRNARQKPTSNYTIVKDLVNVVLLFVAIFLACDLLFGWRKGSLSFDDQKHPQVFDVPTLNCIRPVRLHNAFSSLCRPDQPGVVYSARFGGLGGWELEILHSGDFATSFHVFDPTPLVSERQVGIDYHALGLGLREENISLAPPPRPERTYSFLGNQTAGESRRNSLSVSVESLETIMRQFGHSHLAMLHLDLGGMETVLVDGWFRSGTKPPVDQIVIRFSVRPFVLPGQMDPIQGATDSMNKLGFRVIDAWETEFNFVREDSVETGFWASKEKLNSSKR